MRPINDKVGHRKPTLELQYLTFVSVQGISFFDKNLSFEVEKFPPVKGANIIPIIKIVNSVRDDKGLLSY